MKEVKLTNLKKAVGDYQRANAGGWYDPIYGYLMYDKDTGKLWTDEFCGIGHNWWVDYHDQAIVNLSEYMHTHYTDEVSMKTVKKFLTEYVVEGSRVIDYGEAEAYMEDSIKKEIEKIKPKDEYTIQEYFDAYSAKYLKKYGEEFMWDY